MKRLFAILALTIASVFADEAKQPNILVFVVDDMGWGDSGTYGHPLIQTPNMDRFAKEGIKFNQCYSACGVCSPSRAAILTGRTPYRNGVWRHLSGSHEAHLRAEEITYPELLKEAGYSTCHVGKWHLLSKPQFGNPDYPNPKDHGYDYWMYTHNNAHPSHENPDNFYRMDKPVGKIEGFSAQIVANEAQQWLNTMRDKEKPFLLSIWLHEPHSPIATNPEFSKLYGDHENKKYMGNITQLDHALGQIMDTLEETGEADNTFFFFTSDNGPVPTYGGDSGGLRGNKRSDYEGGIRVPGLLKWPAKIKGGIESNEPIIGSDLFSTILDIVGIDQPTDRTIDGISILPHILEGRTLTREKPMFWRTHVSPVECRVAMRVGDWKIIGNDTLENFELYKVSEDWQEKNELSAQEPERFESLKKQIIALWKDIEQEGPAHWWKEEDGRGRKLPGQTHTY